MFTVFRRSMRVRLYSLLGLLALTALGSAAACSYAIRVHTADTAQSNRAAEAARLAERVNAHVLGVVMDSRGIYWARTATETTSFATPLKARLLSLQRDVAAWQPLVPEESQAAFARLKQAIEEFVRFRTELARLGTEEGASAAERMGNNEANRANRQTLNDALTESAAATAALADRLTAAADAKGARLGMLVPGITVPVVFAVAFGVVVMTHRSVLVPLTGVTNGLTTMAAGELSAVVPGCARMDEIGRMAAAAEQLRDSLVSDATKRKAAELKLLDAFERMELMATTDGLTSLANRRCFDDVADREWRRCTQDRLPISVMLLDADRFKLFNDRYGHLAGDDCLRAISSQLGAAARRPGDLAARYGGEEFVIVMANMDQVGALVVAECLRGFIQALGIIHEENVPVGVVTVSIGVATAWPSESESKFGSISVLLSAADAALYRAKSSGRNQVVAAAGVFSRTQDQIEDAGPAEETGACSPRSRSDVVGAGDDHLM